MPTGVGAAGKAKTIIYRVRDGFLGLPLILLKFEHRVEDGTVGALL
jgi:hypothetical protein